MKTSRLSVLALLCALMMLSGLLPATAQAAQQNGVYINGVPLKPNQQIPYGKGWVIYSPQLPSLALYNATITATGPEAGIVSIGKNVLHIFPFGDNHIVCEYGVGIQVANIYLNGQDTNSTLTISADTTCIECTKLEVYGNTTLNLECTGNNPICKGIEAKGADSSITLTNAKVTSKGSVVCQKNITVGKGGELNVTNVPACDDPLLESREDSLYIRNGGKVNVDAATTGAGPAIRARKDILIDQSTVTAKTAGNYVAVSAKNVTVSGASDVEAEGAGGAISATGNLTLSPDAGKLLEMKAGASKSAAAHFTGSPYSVATSFSATQQPDKSMTYVRIQEHTHAYQWVVDKQPTATEEGLKLEKCDDCGDIRATEPIPATGGGTVDPQPDPPEPPTPPAPPKDDPPVTIPQTGDTTPVALLLAACACACAALLLLRRAKTAR